MADTILDYLDKMAVGGYEVYVADWIGPSHVCRELRLFTWRNRRRFEDSQRVLAMMGMDSHLPWAKRAWRCFFA